jgi:predicted transcriptional regulator
MKKLPCENAIWETIPLIRKGIACCMVNEFGLSQKEAAELIGITPAAVSQYRCNKRASKKIEDVLLLNEIKSSTKLIIDEGNKVLDSEICRLCRLMNEKYPCPELK